MKTTNEIKIDEPVSNARIPITPREAIQNYLDRLQTTVHIEGNFDPEVEEVEIIKLIEVICNTKINTLK